MKGSALSARQKKNEKSRHPTSAAQPNFNQLSAPAHQWLEMDNSMFAANHESSDDKHVIKKYNEIRMDDASIEGVNRLIESIESALKSVSDKITEYLFIKPH